MLVWLAELLTPHFTFFNVFSYLTFRAILSIITGLVVALWMGPRLIRRSSPVWWWRSGLGRASSVVCRS